MYISSGGNIIFLAFIIVLFIVGSIVWYFYCLFKSGCHPNDYGTRGKILRTIYYLGVGIELELGR